MTILIVVESPGKIDKIEKMLGDGYKVVASFGHIQDLDPKTLSIDVNNNYEPHYVIPPEKMKVVQNLRYNNSQCDEVIIASDLDREGEMIGFSIMDVLKLVEPKRIVFNEITKKAILTALENPGKVNMEMVYAQQTRRLLDRLVGYKISPLLWRNLDLKSIDLSTNSKGGLSAGRVQSVVVRIIVDLENEIKLYQSNSYFKTSIVFEHNSTKIPCILTHNKTLYRIENKDKSIELLNCISTNVKNQTGNFIVSNITTNETSKSPPPPHITSSLMQEASTRHGMSSKKTMEVAQKLYEAGHITYMRTDSTVLSNEAVASCKKYIEKTFGEKYYMYRAHKTKSKDAQEAHEAIRPTKIDTTQITDMNEDAKKLYALIWKRTVASLMACAIIDIQTVEIDFLDKNKLTLLTLSKDLKFTSNFETIKFDGYLSIYNNHGKDKKDGEENESDENIISGRIDIKKDTVVAFDKVDISEEYTKPPLRYNEAGLIKYLKKNGIGRPSTYASIISKIIERNYVAIQNIEGVAKEVVILSLTKTLGKVKEKVKTISIGKENMKISPTPMGTLVNDFMMKHFAPIMDIKFTADMEKMLDKVASGKAKWFNVLDIYYKLFSPMVEELEKTMVAIKDVKSDDKVIGTHPTLNQPIFLTKAKYGMCIKISDGDKMRFASIDDIKPEDITLEKAVELLEYPKTLGKIGTSIVTLNKGKYGLYFKIGTKIIGIKDEKEPTLEYAKQLADSAHDSNTFKVKNKIVALKNGQYGYYLSIANGTKKPTNVPVPKKIDINTLTDKVVSGIIDNYEKYKKENK
jgi:DNA topoisomerase-1